MIRAFLINGLCLIFCLSACTRTAEPVAVATAPEVSREPDPEKLALMGDFRPEVVARRHRELIWNPVSIGLSLFAYDAIQTRQEASAHLELVNGSKLDLSENALVILTPSVVDRAVIRRGKLTAETTGELWILTSAALLRLAPDKSGKKASARLQIQEGKQLRVELTAGKAILEREREPAIAVSPRTPVVLNAPVRNESFGAEEPTTWERALPPVHEALAAVPPPVPPVRAVAMAIPLGELSILSPTNYAEIEGDSVVLRGKLSTGKAAILVNGLATKIDGAGNFELTVPLQKGPNSVLVQAVGADGTSRFRRWTILRR